MSLRGQWCIWPTLRPWPAPHGACLEHRIEGSPATRWGRNLTANPQATIHLESGSDVVMALRADAERHRRGHLLDEDNVGAALAERIAASFAARYNGYRTQGRGFFILVRRVAFAWSRFPHDSTRWTFGEPSSSA
jgi:hypothetical protein